MHAFRFHARIPNASRACVAGVSLVELMVALVIGTLLLLALVEVFSAARNTYRTAEGVGRVQENARFAMDYLQRDFRMVGHLGCVNDQAHKQQPVPTFTSHIDPALRPQLNFTVSVEGFDATSTGPGDSIDLAAPTGGWSPALPDYVSALAPLPGSDVLVLRFLNAGGAPVESMEWSGGNTGITVTGASWTNLTQDGIAAPSLFGIADCTYADIFAGTGNAAAATATVSGLTINRYTPGAGGQATLYRADAVAYYIATGASGRPALWRARWDAAGAAQAEELVDGIENMQLLYGQDRSADVSNPSGFIGNQVTAATIGIATTVAGERNWRRVGMIQVGFVATSSAPAAVRQASESGRALVLGTSFTAADDGRLRVPYESTIALRNRLYGN